VAAVVEKVLVVVEAVGSSKAEVGRQSAAESIVVAAHKTIAADVRALEVFSVPPIIKISYY